MQGGGVHGSGSQGSGDVEADVAVPLEDAYRGAKRAITFSLPGGSDKTLNVTLPRGVRDGQRIRLKGQGQPRGGSTGDLLLRVRYEPHPKFRVEDDDVLVTVGVYPWQVALGRSIRIPTLGGEVNMKLPASARSGTRLRLKGRGLPATSKQSQDGDQYVIIDVIVPAAQDEEVRALYEKLETRVGSAPP
jgi:curved DNA-binding protein